MEKPVYFQYKGKRIYYTDYSGIQDTNFFLERISITLQKVDYFLENDMKNLLLLNNVTDAYITREVVKGLKKVATKGQPIIKKSAVIGVSLSKRIFLNIVNKFSGTSIQAFASEEEAKEWLIKG